MRLLHIGVSVLSLALTFAGAISAGADANQQDLQQGAYEVSVRLELPHLDSSAAMKIASICVPAEEVSASLGLTVLSDNNPLSACPISNVQRDGGILSFDIVCPGVNAASASAVYNLQADRFAGRITMKMGGKNMTMTEVQTGRRSGSCREPAPPRS